jgi:putative membrane protein
MTPSRVHPRVPAMLLALFAGSIAFSLAGMMLMRVAPSAVAWAGPWLPWLMRVPTWIYMLALPALALVLYLADLGWRRSLFFLVWGSFVGMMAELMGTGTGYPFGAYAYTSFLDPKILGHVPYLIPLSWYAVSIVSLDLAARLGIGRAQRILVAALYMVLWDVALDPAMGAGFPVWRWETEGFFYGMPAINWVGWFLTSVVIVWGYEVIGAFRASPSPSRWAIPVWLVNGAFAVGICVVTGMWDAVLIGTLAILLPPAALWGRTDLAPVAGR